MIGIATLQGFDIHQRILVFYQSLFLIVAISAGISLFLYVLYRRRMAYLHNEMQVFNATSLVGLFFLFFKLYGENTDSLIAIIIFIQAFWIFFIVLKNNFSDKLFSISIFAALMCISISEIFFFKEINLLLTLGIKLNFLQLFCVCGFFTTLFWSLLFRNRSEKIIFKVLWVFAPIAIIPLFSVLKNEIYLILNNKDIFYFTSKKIYFLALFFLTIWILFRSYLFPRKIKLSTLDFKQLLSKIYFPFSILSLATFLVYQPFAKPSSEMFELANRTLPIMEMVRFGTIPVIQKFNSHMFSEIFSGLLYTFINGYSGQAFIIYDFILLSASILIIYYFVLYFTGNAFVALFFALFFPLSSQLFPGHFILCLLAFFVFIKAIDTPATIQKYLGLLTIIAFLLIWQIDLGYAALWTIGGVFLLHIFVEKKSAFEKIIFWKSFLIAIGGVLLIVFLLLFRKINLGESISTILNYFSSSQSYGTISMGDVSLSSYKMQYFIFPFLGLILLGYLILKFQHYCSEKHTKIIVYALIFLTILYFVNFQRGLVRHSFIEGKDYLLSSFIFYIFSGTTFLFFQKRSSIFKFLLFTGTACFLILNYNFPTLPAKNFDSPFSEMIQKYDTIQELKPVAKTIDRCPMSNDFKKIIFADFKNYIDKNLKKNQTFIDFSNSPMLYFYTEKETPGVFNQNTLSLQNDYLQNNFLSNLKKYDTPLLVYSNFSESFWDHVDDVPNAVRHYRMAEYFFQHYAPYIIIQNHCVWKKISDTDLKNLTDTLFFRGIESLMKSDSIYFTVQKNNFSNTKYLFKIKYDTLFAEDSCLRYSYSNENKNFKERIKCVYVDSLNKTRFFILDSVSYSKLFFPAKNIFSASVLSAPNIPDFYSQQMQTYNLQQLPSIWANSDPSLESKNKIIDLLSQEKIIVKNNMIECNLPEKVNRSEGNYIFIKMNSDLKKTITMRLTYGKNNSTSGAFLFEIPSGTNRNNKFAIRVSTQYNWYSIKNNWIKIGALDLDSSQIKIERISLLKGD
ncbi:MAG: hypothetical protein ABI199_01650 [Bacteroidia bacterium]